MRIVINTLGTQGDVQPYVALGSGLQDAGHDVLLVTHKVFEPFVRTHGLRIYPISIDPRQVLIQQSLANVGNNPVAMVQFLHRNFQGALRSIFVDTMAAGRGAELMVNSGLSHAGWHVAEKLNIPPLAAFLWPVTPSRWQRGAMSKPTPPWLPLRGALAYLSTKLFNQLFFLVMLPLVNECRQSILQLPPMSALEYWSVDSPRHGSPILYGYSAHVVPKPPDWCDKQQISGYWFLDRADGYRPEKGLSNFLAKGQPPIYVGFGSIVDHEREQVTRAVLGALRQTGLRAVLLGGWSDLGAEGTPAFVHRVEAVPHDWLFPRVAAAVHHGGAGTTAAGLRAGIPNVIVPSFGDQFFWGSRVHELGVGPEPIPRDGLTASSLAQAIERAVEDSDMKRRACELGRLIRNEDGIMTAVRLIGVFGREGRFRPS